MSFFNSLNVSASGLTAQRIKMDVISQNIANATTTVTAEGGPYRRRAVVLTPNNPSNFGSVIDGMISSSPLGAINNPIPFRNSAEAFARAGMNHDARFEDFVPSGVSVSSIATDTTPGPLVHDPSHPHADENGYVRMPNVNVVYEMVNMIVASRSYEANLTAMATTRAMINRTLEVGQAR